MMQTAFGRRTTKLTRSPRWEGLSWSLIALGLLHLTLRQPLFLAAVFGSALLYLAADQGLQRLPWLQASLGRHLRPRHGLLAIATTTVLLITAQPAHALFLSGLEEFFITLASEAQSAGSASTLDEGVIGLVFNLIRGVFLLLVAAAALFAYNQAQQGNDWRPIVTQVGLAFGIVIAVDVVTFIFIGDAT